MGRVDYRQLIDHETRAFIARTEGCYPADTIKLGIREQRAIYDRMCRAFFAGYPKGVSAHDQKIGAFPVRIYESATPPATVIYYHGGGFVVGGLESHDDVCAEIRARTGMRVVSVDYRLCPEFKHPTQFCDSRDALDWVAATFTGPLVLAGDSAGANLAAAVAHDARGRNSRIVGQVLIYGGFGLFPDGDSANVHASAPLLSAEEITFYKDIRCHGPEPLDDPTYAPLADTDFSNLPPSVIFSAECDPLSDEGRIYARKITAAGGKAVWFNEAGLVHGYLRARTTVRRARDSFSRIIAALNAVAAAKWPY